MPINDRCEVYWLPPSDREMNKLRKTDPDRALILEELIFQVEENGWILSTKSELVKVLRAKTRVGEIRDVGSGGHRLFFFWEELPVCRKIYISAIPKKRDVTGKARLNGFLDAAEKLRTRLMTEDD